ncbi:MAG: alpha-ketoglutarate-dependent 2,4-dichlorophenoxyacetate dioxygenase [Betaproteobacteria bacterium]|jgi:alpha-ketoglutarate-dependent 2,4-dichlorophenoxyacetate dioxygenase|nr:alpha-ketoglutarate-dependent 2,4-dichlorophenoxyacetate dioxygenase [Betaproteobacteria bacterium]
MDVRQLGPGFFAEVRGVGLADVAQNDAAYAAVRAAFEEYSVLLFRDQAVTDELQAAYSRRFGPLEVAKAASLGEGTPYSILTNLDRATGELVPAGHKEDLRARANQLWHTDSCFKSPPALASVLSARITPSSGGETEFASTRRAWERLPSSLRSRLEHACAWHDYAHSRAKVAPHLASEREKSTLPAVSWRLRWRNPANGYSALYLASHTYAIDGMTKDAAAGLLADLIAFATAPGHTYQHRWRDGDVIMWDNRAVLHRGRPWPNDQARHMVRTTVTATDADGLAEMWPVAAAA